MKLLVDRTDKIEVVVYCWEQDGDVEASHLKDEAPKEGIGSVELLRCIFRKPSYQDSNVIIRNSNFKTEGDETTLNITQFQEQILRALLVDWDMKDEDDKKIPVNTATINNLLPSVARAAVSGVLDRIRI